MSFYSDDEVIVSDKKTVTHGAIDTNELSGDRLTLMLTQRAMFLCPNYLESSAWLEHVPFAFWLVEAHKPKVFVELGTHYGVSYFAFCQAIDHLAIDSRCFAIDTWKGDEHSGFYEDRVFDKVKTHNNTLYSGFSRLVRSTFDQALEHFEDNTVDLLHIDGLHTYEAVKHDFESWLPKLSSRAVVIMHDTNVRERGFGVFKLFSELKTRYSSFEFFHGHGLGILKIGDDQNQIVESLFLSDKSEGSDQQEIRRLFSRMGRGCADALLARKFEGRVRGLASEIEKKNEQLGGIQQMLNKAEIDIANKEGEIDVITKKYDASSADILELKAAYEERLLVNAKKLLEFEKKNKELDEDKRLLVSTMEQRFKEITVLTKMLEDAQARLSEGLGWFSLKKIVPSIFHRSRDSAPPSRYKASTVKKKIRLIRQSGLFDNGWYLHQYPDVKKSGIDPLEHFVKYGAKEGRNPCQGFNTSWYTSRYSDVRDAGVNPLVHYIVNGKIEGREIRSNISK